MCFTVKEEPSFGEMARDYHHAHIAEVRERSARLAAEERAERMAERLQKQGVDVDVLEATAPRHPSPPRRSSPSDSPRRPEIEIGRPQLVTSPSRLKQLFRLD